MQINDQCAFTGKIGFSQMDITPPIGIYSKNWGASRTTILTEQHSPFYIKTVTFQTNNQLFLLVTFDLIDWPDELEYNPKGLLPLLSSRLGISESNIMLHCTHTHSGPFLNSKRKVEPGGELIGPYLITLKAKLLRSIDEALESQTDATLEWASGISPLAQNRDFTDGDRVVTGFNPSGQPDQTVMVGRVTNTSGNPWFTFVHYACHPTTLGWGNKHLSSDYVGVLRKTMQEATGIPCVFLLGSAGDQAPKNQYKSDPKWADQNGKILAYSALGVFEAMNAPMHNLAYAGVVESGAPLAIWEQKPCELEQNSCFSKKLNLQLKVTKNYPAIAVLEEQLKKTTEAPLIERIKRKIEKRKSIGDNNTIDNPAWLWKLGQTVFVGLPNEAYSYLQKTLRKEFPHLAILPLNLTNGGLSYLPDRAQFKTNSYAAWASIVEEGSLESIAELLINEIKKIDN